MELGSSYECSRWDLKRWVVAAKYYHWEVDSDFPAFFETIVLIRAFLSITDTSGSDAELVWALGPQNEGPFECW